MKNSPLLFALALAILTGCSTTTPQKQAVSGGKHSPETVLVTYHVKAGKEAEFEQVLARAWSIYTAEHLVFAKPHVIVRDGEGTSKPRFVEIFTWVSHSAPDHAPDSVKNLWNEMQSLCEARDSHGGLEGGEVEIIEPKAR